MEYGKLPTDLPRQIEMLKEMGMVIENEDVALKCLDSISYFRLSNYWRVMEADSEARLFRPDSRFEDVVDLYVFDRKLRDLVFTVVHDIEIALRTRVIQHFSMRYGAFWFIERGLFTDEDIYEACLNDLKKELSRTKENFIKEHFDKYDSPDFPPVWKSLELVSFGTLSKLYCNMKDGVVKNMVAKDFGLPEFVFLESWIRCATVLRNICAHHARLWNRRFPQMPGIPERLPFPWISNRRFPPIKLYAHLCYLAYMDMRVNPNSDFRSEAVKLLLTKPYSTLRSMGFPADWQSEPLWQV